MKILIIFPLLFSFIFCFGQKAKPKYIPKNDTIAGVVIYTAESDVLNISKYKYQTYTVPATEIMSDTGVISIHTATGYIDLKKNYEFVPFRNLQPKRLRRNP